MNAADAIRVAVPVAPVKGTAEVAFGGGSVVLVNALAHSMGFAVEVRDGESGLRPATRPEVEAAGFPFGGIVCSIGGESVDCAWAMWPRRSSTGRT